MYICVSVFYYMKNAPDLNCLIGAFRLHHSKFSLFSSLAIWPFLNHLMSVLSTKCLMSFFLHTLSLFLSYLLFSYTPSLSFSLIFYLSLYFKFFLLHCLFVTLSLSFTSISFCSNYYHCHWTNPPKKKGEPVTKFLPITGKQCP